MPAPLSLLLMGWLTLLAGPTASTAAEPAVAEAAERLVAAQASALERFDLDAYLATFVPERRESESRIFQRSRLLPVTSAQAEVMSISAVEGGWQAKVEMRFALYGLPEDNPFVHSLDVSLEDQPDGWLVSNIVERTARPLPWRQGDFVVHRAHHFLIYGPPHLRADLVEVAADAEAAYASLYRQGLVMDSGYMIYFTDGRDFARVTGGLSALGVAVARYTQVEGRTQVDSRAFYVNGGLFSESLRRRLTPEARRKTVLHELVHLVLAETSRSFTPPWLKEGVAVYFSGDLSFDANRRLVRSGMEHLNLEAMTRSRILGWHGFGGAHRGSRQAADEYLFAGNVIAYLVEKHGQEKLLDLYRSYAELPAEDSSEEARSAGSWAWVFESLSGNRAASTTSALLKQHYGLGIDALEADVKRWLSVPHR